MSELFTNFAETTISGSVGTGDVTINVASGDGALFPSPTGGDFFRAVLYKFATGEREVVTVSARSTDAMTVTRAQEGTTALAMNDGDLFELRPTAAFFSSMATTLQIQEGVPNFVVAGGTGNAITGTFTPTITTLADGTVVRFLASADNTGAATFNPDATGAVAIKKMVAGAIADVASGDIKSGLLYTMVYDDTNTRFVLQSGSSQAATNVANVFTKTQVWAKGADVASGSALTLGTDGNYFDITGTTTITSIGTLGIGTRVRLHFDASLTLTHHATDLILPGGANIVTQAGDEAEIVEYASGDWRMVAYQRATNPPAVGAWEYVETKTASASASLDFTDLDDGYDHEFVHEYVTPATDSVGYRIRTSPDTGGSPTFDSGATDYTYDVYGRTAGTSSNSISSNSDNNSASIVGIVSNGIGNGTNEGVGGSVIVRNPGSTSNRCRIEINLSYHNTSNEPGTTTGIGERKDTGAVNAIQFFFSSGNIASGDILHYRRRRSS